MQRGAQRFDRYGTQAEGKCVVLGAADEYTMGETDHYSRTHSDEEDKIKASTTSDKDYDQ